MSEIGITFGEAIRGLQARTAELEGRILRLEVHGSDSAQRTGADLELVKRDVVEVRTQLAILRAMNAHRRWVIVQVVALIVGVVTVEATVILALTHH